MSELSCERPSRRADIRRVCSNGLDYLEVSDDQLVLTVTFLGKAPEDLTERNVRIEGGRRVRDIAVRAVRVTRHRDPDIDDHMRVTVDRPGDFSVYTLRLVDAAAPQRPLPGLDPRYAALAFSFKAGCPSELDCAAAPPCPPAVPAEPEIPYLAKDYASLRQLILDRLAIVMPQWRERHVPDIAIALVELFAYVGDHLSYHQDAVATEAYLDTARRRVSVRRHTRLVDYRLHDGCNARAWVCVEVGAPLVLEPGEACFVAAPPAAGLPAGALDCDGLRTLVAGGAAVYEPLSGGRTRLLPAHNTIGLWTWGDAECCLPAGATSATLVDAWAAHGDEDCEGEERPRVLQIAPGDVLVFEERIGPQTGNRADADPSHRQAVRLTSVRAGEDPLYDQPVLKVTWALADALEFALCISTVAGEDCAPIADVSVACANVVLVDHGATLGWCDGKGEDLPPREADEPDPICDGPCRPVAQPPRPRRYAPALRRRPVTQRTAYPAPQSLALGRAAQIDAIPGHVFAYLRTLVRRVRAGEELDAEACAFLLALFGSRRLAACGIRRSCGPQDLAELEALVAHADHLLADRVRHTRALAARVRAGDTLPDSVDEELGELWGGRYLEAARLDDRGWSGPARGDIEQDPRDALPAVRIEEAVDMPPPLVWEPRRDLLASSGQDRHFVGELDDDGALRLRFGIGGRELAPGAKLTARYRVGNGRSGNVGRETISRIVLRTVRNAAVARVRNPLPASGGTEPESIADAKLHAPFAFRHRPERAVTAADYATLAEQVAGVQRAAARLRWTGSWYEAHVGLDPLVSGQSLYGDVTAAVSERLSGARRLGHDVCVASARPTALDVALTICVAADHRQGQVRAALLEALSDRVLRDGRHGFFHPDVLSFGSGVAMSAVVAAAQAVPGVELVQVRRLRRLFGLGQDVPTDGVLAFGPLEIPELANDPNEPERGRLELELRGGR